MENKIINNRILVFSVLLYASIVICPFVNAHANWYITAIPATIIYVKLLRTSNLATPLLKTTLALLILVFFEYHFIRQGVALMFAVINQLVKWVPCFLAMLCYKNLNRRELYLILQVCLLLVSVTSMTSIIGIEQYPSAARVLAGAATEEERNFFMSYNIGGYDHVFSAVLAIPAYFFLITNGRKTWRTINIILLLVNIYCIYVSSYTTALIIVGITLVLILIEYKPQFKTAIIVGSAIFFIFAGTGLLSNIFFWLSDNVGSDYVKDRFLQVAYLLNGQSIDSIATETNTERLELTDRALQGFLSNPIFGQNLFEFHNNAISGHALILDILSTSGLVGFFIYFYLFYSIFKNTLHIKFGSMPYESRIIWVSFIILSTVDPTGFAPIYMVLFLYSAIINNNYIDDI